MVIDFLKYLYKGYKREKFLEKKRYIFQGNTEYVLFSGTSLGDNGDVRHLNDLYFMLFLLKKYKIDKDNITLSVDEKILSELKSNPLYKKEISKTINEQVGTVINPENFTRDYSRDKNKNLVFISSGHGHINGLHLTKSNTFISSDYFEDISSETHDTLLIMSQCYAGAFHHLDTRKNFCVMGASDYQESLSINLIKLITFSDNSGHLFFKNRIEQNLGNFIINELSFNYKMHNINPFIFSLFLVLLEPEKQIASRKKHLINIYKNTVSITSENLNDTYQHVKIKTGTNPQDYNIEGIRITQQPYLLNKIIASRYNILESI